MNILFDSPPLSLKGYDGNVGCVGAAFKSPPMPPPPDFLGHVGNTVLLSVI